MEHIMKRFLSLLVAVMLAAWPAFAQENPVPRTMAEAGSADKAQEESGQWYTADRLGLRKMFDRGSSKPEKSGNPYVGSWKGRGSDGYTYVFKFTGAAWDSAIEKQGVSVPLYKGTYTYTSSEASLKVTEEINTSTMKWMPAKKAITLTGNCKNNVLTVPAITDAKMKK